MKRMALALVIVVVSQTALAQQPLEAELKSRASHPEFVFIAQVWEGRNYAEVYRSRTVPDIQQNEVSRRIFWEGEPFAFDSYRLLRASGEELKGGDEWQNARGKLALLFSMPGEIDPAYMKLVAKDTLVLQSRGPQAEPTLQATPGPQLAPESQLAPEPRFGPEPQLATEPQCATGVLPDLVRGDWITFSLDEERPVIRVVKPLAGTSVAEYRKKRLGLEKKRELAAREIAALSSNAAYLEREEMARYNAAGIDQEDAQRKLDHQPIKTTHLWEVREVHRDYFTAANGESVMNMPMTSVRYIIRDVGLPK